MQIWILAMIGAFFLAGARGYSGSSILRATATCILPACILFYIGLKNEIDASINAQALTVWPVMAIIYLLIIIVLALVGTLIGRLLGKRP